MNTGLTDLDSRNQNWSRMGRWWRLNRRKRVASTASQKKVEANSEFRILVFPSGIPWNFETEILLKGLRNIYIFFKNFTGNSGRKDRIVRFGELQFKIQIQIFKKLKSELVRCSWPWLWPVRAHRFWIVPIGPPANPNHTAAFAPMLLASYTAAGTALMKHFWNFSEGDHCHHLPTRGREATVKPLRQAESQRQLGWTASGNENRWPLISWCCYKS